ncbi:MAG: flagellar biosynthesis protein FlhA [Planctomycetaceae bacterium]
MPSAATAALRNRWARNRGLVVPALMAASILVVVAPLPVALLDLLLSANIAVSILILMTTLYVRKPLEFSVFPTLILATTLARLVLSVASTRLILTRGGFDGTAAAGGVIRAFGDFVAGGQIAVGLIIFSILAVIQFLVITKGATRIGEVAARFALDGLPGRQMAIDADVQAGLINSVVAAERRQELARQADFYGAMDGAGKFVRGDAVATLVIAAVNIVGGLYVGLLEYGMSLSEATAVFTRLTIGDALVTQLPAFLVSLAAGLLVTRSSVESDLTEDVLKQLAIRPAALGVAAVFVAGLSLTGLPRLPLLLMAGGLGALAATVPRRARAPSAESPDDSKQAPLPTPPATGLEDSLRVDSLQLELGFGLIRMADPGQKGDLLDRVTRMRQKLAHELGMIVPKVSIRDNIRLHQRQYQIRIHDVPVASGEVFPEGFLAIDTGAASEPIQGLMVTDRASRRPAVWIEAPQRARAESLGYHVIEPQAAICTHLCEVVRHHSDELLSRQQVHELLENLKRRSPRIVEELVPALLRPAHVHQVLCNLLRERVPIRHLETILETLAEHADRTQDPAILTEFVRRALGRVICQQYRDREGVLRVVTLDPAFEELAAQGAAANHSWMSPQRAQEIVGGITAELNALAATGYPPVVLTTKEARTAIRRLTSPSLPQAAILSFDEISRDTRIESQGQVAWENAFSETQRASALAA